MADAQELDALKAAHRTTWAAGDRAGVSDLFLPISERLVDEAEVRSGLQVLEVGTDTGTVAVLAAQRDAKVVGLDLAPELFESARRRAGAAGVGVAWVEGDVEDLRFEDGHFERVLSGFGVQFAPRHEVAAREMVRVCKPAGLIGLANWTPREVDQSRALGLDDLPPVEHVHWRLEVDADAPEQTIDELKERADARCPGVYCLRNPISLATTVSQQT